MELACESRINYPKSTIVEILSKVSNTQFFLRKAESDFLYTSRSRQRHRKRRQDNHSGILPISILQFRWGKHFQEMRGTVHVTRQGSEIRYFSITQGYQISWFDCHDQSAGFQLPFNSPISIGFRKIFAASLPSAMVLKPNPTSSAIYHTSVPKPQVDSGSLWVADASSCG